MRRSVALLGAFLLAGCGGSDSESLPQGRTGELDAADFVDRIDNPYWPMAPGRNGSTARTAPGSRSR